MSITPGQWGVYDYRLDSGFKGRYKKIESLSETSLTEIASFIDNDDDAFLIAAAPEMKVWIEEMRAAIIEGNSDAITALLTTGRALLRRIEGEEETE